MEFKEGLDPPPPPPLDSHFPPDTLLIILLYPFKQDISGRWCIICPYHKQNITLDTGEGLHFSIDPKDLKKPPKLCSKGAVQRIHQVQVKEDKVFVTLSSTKQYIPSDFYYSKKIEKD